MEFICHIRLKKKNLSSSLVCKSNINTKATYDFFQWQEMATEKRTVSAKMVLEEI